MTRRNRGSRPDSGPSLQAAVADLVGDGYRVAVETESSAQLVRPKAFSFPWALAWFLILGVGVLVYLFYYLSKEDDIVYLRVRDGRVVTERPRAVAENGLAQRLIALGGLVVIVGVTVVALLAAGVIGGEGGGVTPSGVSIQPVEFVEPPRAAGQEGLAVGISEGELAPDFVISDFEGARQRLSDFRGKVVYLNFWATWCTPCLFELPEIQELQERNSDSLVVVAVNRREGLDKAKDWLRGLPRTDGGKGVSFAVNGLDPNDSLYERYVRLKPAMPVSVFINPEGEISSVYNGAIRLPQMEQAVNEALASASAASAE